MTMQFDVLFAHKAHKDGHTQLGTFPARHLDDDAKEGDEIKNLMMCSSKSLEEMAVGYELLEHQNYHAQDWDVADFWLINDDGFGPIPLEYNLQGWTPMILSYPRVYAWYDWKFPNEFYLDVDDDTWLEEQGAEKAAEAGLKFYVVNNYAEHKVLQQMKADKGLVNQCAGINGGQGGHGTMCGRWHGLIPDGYTEQHVTVPDAFYVHYQERTEAKLLTDVLMPFNEFKEFTEDVIVESHLNNLGTWQDNGVVETGEPLFARAVYVVSECNREDYWLNRSKDAELKTPQAEAAEGEYPQVWLFRDGDSEDRFLWDPDKTEYSSTAKDPYGNADTELEAAQWWLWFYEIRNATELWVLKQMEGASTTNCKWSDVVLKRHDGPIPEGFEVQHLDIPATDADPEGDVYTPSGIKCPRCEDGATEGYDSMMASSSDDAGDRYCRCTTCGFEWSHHLYLSEPVYAEDNEQPDLRKPEMVKLRINGTRQAKVVVDYGLNIPRAIYDAGREAITAYVDEVSEGNSFVGGCSDTHICCSSELVEATPSPGVDLQWDTLEVIDAK